MDLCEENLVDEILRYDKDLPLQIEEKEAPFESAEYQPGCQQFHVTITSVHDQRVPALLSIPSHSAPPFPVILMLHGVLGHKSSYNQVKRSVFLTNAG